MSYKTVIAIPTIALLLLLAFAYWPSSVDEFDEFDSLGSDDRSSAQAGTGTGQHSSSADADPAAIAARAEAQRRETTLRRAKRKMGTPTVTLLDDGRIEGHYNLLDPVERRVFLPNDSIRGTSTGPALLLDRQGRGSTTLALTFRGSFTIEFELLVDGGADLYVELALALPKQKRFASSREFLFLQKGPYRRALMECTKLINHRRSRLAVLRAKKPPLLKKGRKQAVRFEQHSGRLTVTIGKERIAWQAPDQSWKRQQGQAINGALFRLRVANATRVEIDELAITKEFSEEWKGPIPQWLSIEEVLQRSRSRRH